MPANLQNQFRQLGTKEVAKANQWFFKTEKGDYGYGDCFLGIRVPAIRKFAKDYRDLSLSETKKFIKSKFHEERMLGLIILMNKYQKTKSEEEKEKYYDTYVKHFKYINNWDLVDVTCPRIVGGHLLNRDRSVLYEWAVSDNLWVKRIAMITNWWFIRANDLKDVFKIAKILLKDEHDLIHKAVGWMIREAAQKDMARAEKFLKQHYKSMPRTMLRYSIEKFPETKRQKYLKGTI